MAEATFGDEHHIHAHTEVDEAYRPLSAEFAEQILRYEQGKSTLRNAQDVINDLGLDAEERGPAKS